MLWLWDYLAALLSLTESNHHTARTVTAANVATAGRIVQLGTGRKEIIGRRMAR
jgi:D-arabinose 5-phosphate isomerase GutQ